LTLEASGGNASGLVTLNGQNMSNEIFRKKCSVVAQEDYHWSFLTCRETLTYACQLYQIKLSDAEVKAKVDAMLKSTGLESCADTNVGSALIKGISGGQKRRLSVVRTASE
jgi:ABC-type multidrug transport system ATPase subunit